MQAPIAEPPALLPAPERFLEIAGFRNRLTHFYEDATPGELRAILRRDLADLEALAAELEVAAARLASG